ncbi:MAG: hypothetical protein BWX49_00313 [Bacteroidetes bacterium ADurb.Bin008]|nr:MAG: hypothetical protein BWX49_00313 [Bacteroidetes bacterium ADurb.Bin008]
MHKRQTEKNDTKLMKPTTKLVINILYALAVCFILLGIILKFYNFSKSGLIILISFAVGTLTLIFDITILRRRATYLESELKRREETK